MARTIGVRVLEYTTKGGRNRKVRVEVESPARDRKGRDWSCVYRIVGLGRSRRSRARGVDALQALILALAALSQEVALLGKRDPTLTWLGDRWLGLDVHCILRVQSQRLLKEIGRRRIKIPADLRRELIRETGRLP